MTVQLRQAREATADAQRRRSRQAGAWEWVGALAIATALFRQAPGLVMPDTKFDLFQAPGTFLSRVFGFWDPSAGFGQIQNQATGYLWPIGPYYWLADLLQIPDWTAQRIWHITLVLLGYFGVIWLTRRLGIASTFARVSAGLAYALAPRALSLFGGFTNELLPLALLPWTLYFLHRGTESGSPRRWAALAALCTVSMSGVNATATLAVLPLPLLFLLTRTRGPRRSALLAWWSGLVVLGTLWWTVPLLLQNRYGLQFIPYTEPASVTTAWTDLAEVGRGTSHWLGQLILPTGPWWPTAHRFVSDPWLVAGTGLVLAVGLAGLSLRRMREAPLMRLSALIAISLLSLGFVGSLDSPISEQIRYLLEGPLGPLRNVGKFDPLLRLPLAVGVAVALERVDFGRLKRALASNMPDVPAAAAAITAVVGLSLSTLPLWQAELPADGSFSEVPQWWNDAGDWLESQDAEGRVLLLPASGFAEYYWGRPLDEPFQSALSVPWAVRNQIPLGSAANIRLLDGINQRINEGRGSAGLSKLLARMGVEYVLVRNDLEWRRALTTRPGLVAQTLAESPGLQPVAQFGPDVGTTITVFDNAADSRLDGDLPSIQIFRVQGAAARLSAFAAAEVVRASGGPEAMLQLAEQDVVGARPVILDGDGVPPDAAVAEQVITDTLRLRTRNFGLILEGESATLTPDSPQPRRPINDYTPFPLDGRQSVARYDGLVADVVASTSLADADNPGRHVSEAQPWAGADGNLLTAWTSGNYGSPDGEWLEIRYREPVDLSDVTVRFTDVGGAKVTLAELSSENGSLAIAPNPEGVVRAGVPGGPATTLRVTVATVVGGAGFEQRAAIAEIEGPGLPVAKALVTAALPAADESTSLSIRRAPFIRGGCIRVDTETRCSRQLPATGEDTTRIDRAVSLPNSVVWRISGETLVTPGTGADTVLAAGRPDLRVAWSSSQTADPQVTGYAAVDADPGTTWVTDPADLSPELTLSWDAIRTVDRLAVRHSSGSASGIVTQALLVGDDGVRTLEIPRDGSFVSFDPLRTTSLRLEITGVDSFVDLPYDVGISPQAQPGISELLIPAISDLIGSAAPTDRVVVPCGSGPTLRIDGLDVPTRLVGTRAAVEAFRPLEFFACRTVSLSSGEHRIQMPDTPRDFPLSLIAREVGAAEAGLATPTSHRLVTVTGWGQAERTATVAAGPASILVTTENRNEGWRATTADGTVLNPVTIDGWRQGWMLPAGEATTVLLEFRPQSAVRWSIVASLAIGILALFVGLRRSGGGPEPAPVRAAAANWIAPLGAALLVLLGGWFAAAALIVLAWAARWRAAIAAIAWAGPTLAVTGQLAGLWLVDNYAVGRGYWWSQALVLAGLAALVVLIAIDSGAFARWRGAFKPLWRRNAEPDGAGASSSGAAAPQDAN